ALRTRDGRRESMHARVREIEVERDAERDRRVRREHRRRLAEVSEDRGVVRGIRVDGTRTAEVASRALRIEREEVLAKERLGRDVAFCHRAFSDPAARAGSSASRQLAAAAATSTNATSMKMRTASTNPT